MKKLYFLVYPVVAILSLVAAFAARADGNTPIVDDTATQVWAHTKTRAEVRQELVQARLSGAPDAYRAAYYATPAGASTHTRAEVRAEMFAAKAAGFDELFREDSGAFYLSQQRPAADASRVMAAAPARSSVK